MPRKSRAKPDGRIEKPEDKAWQDWYNSLDAKEHENYLSKLGLSKEDIEEWEAGEGFKNPEKKRK